MQRSPLAKRDCLALICITVFAYLFGLGSLPLLGPDEPRYAEVAREMFLRRDFVTPTLGGHTWFEKPALLYWMMMGSYKLLGLNEWGARLGPAICGLLTVLAIWWAGRRLETDELKYFGFWSAVVGASLLGVLVFSRAASFDILITMTTTWAFACFLRSELAESKTLANKLLAGFYAMVGASLLAKGLVGIVIPFGVIALYYLLKRTWPRSFVLSLLWGGPLALAVASLWYGPVIFIHRWTFINEFFIQHHFARFVSNKYHHPQPIYFYPAILLLLTLPWTPFLVAALVRARGWQWRLTDSLNTVRIFAFAWLIWPIVFFSFSGSKLPGYILPVLPAAALLSGEIVERTIAHFRSFRWPLRATGVVCLILAIGAFVFVIKAKFFPATGALFGILPMAVAGASCFMRPRQRLAPPLLVALASFALVMTAVPVSAPLAQRESVRDLLKVADLRGYRDAPILAQRGDDRSAEFYANSRVIYRPDGEPKTIDEISLSEARQVGRMLVFIPVQHADQLEKTIGTEFIGTNGRLSLFGWTPQ